MEPEPEPAATTYTSSKEDDGYDNNCTFLDNMEDGYNNNNDGSHDNYISRSLCGIGPINQQDFTIQVAVNIGLCSKYISKEHCWICPLGCLYVPASYPKRERIQEQILLFANKGTHPIYINLPFFKISPMKIHANQITQFIAGTSGRNYSYSGNIIHEPPTL